MTIQTLFIEAHEITRLGMRSIVVDSDIAIASEATSISEAQDHIANSKFDLILTDVRTGKEDMLPWLAKVKLELPRLNILFFSDTENATHIARIYSIGANGLIPKTATPQQILSAIRMASNGESLWTKEELKRMSSGLGNAKSIVESDIPITTREAEVLKKIDRLLEPRNRAVAWDQLRNGQRTHPAPLSKSRCWGSYTSCNLGGPTKSGLAPQLDGQQKN